MNVFMKQENLKTREYKQLKQEKAIQQPIVN